MLLDNKNFHKSVLFDEVITNLEVCDNKVYVDGTFGAGGYSRAILSKADCTLYAFDRDLTVEKFANNLRDEFSDRFNFIHDKFSNMKNSLENIGVKEVDGIVLDLGVSSMQLDEDDRGFSFNSKARLDMRMDNSIGISAFDVVNHKSEKELSDIIRNFGEDRKHRQIAKNIIKHREKAEINTAIELANIIREVYGKYNPKKIDPATKTFQAIRIFINDELGELKKALNDALDLLKKGGKLLVVSFHSLEDSYVKKFFRDNSGYNDRNISRYVPQDLQQSNDHKLSVLNAKAIKPSQQEIDNNIRARSSRLRTAIKR